MVVCVRRRREPDRIADTQGEPIIEPTPAAIAAETASAAVWRGHAEGLTLTGEPLPAGTRVTWTIGANATVVGAVRKARLIPGDVAVVLGRGAARVVACDVDDRRRQAALAFGADRVCDPSALAREVEDLTGGAGAEVALVGSVSPAPEVSFEPSEVVRRLTTLVGSHNYPIEDLVPRSYPLTSFGDAVADARSRTAPRIAVSM